MRAYKPTTLVCAALVLSLTACDAVKTFGQGALTYGDSGRVIIYKNKRYCPYVASTKECRGIKAKSATVEAKYKINVKDGDKLGLNDAVAAWIIVNGAALRPGAKGVKKINSLKSTNSVFVRKPYIKVEPYKKG